MKINGQKVELLFYETILDAANRAGIFIPTLCKDTAFMDSGGCCRLCTVEITQEGRTRLAGACETIGIEDMEINTETEAIKKSRQTLLKLLHAQAPESETVLKLMKRYGVEADDSIPKKEQDRDCILCGRCTLACRYWVHGAIGNMNRGIERKIDTPYEKETDECVGCGSCEGVCPMGSIKVQDQDGRRKVWNNEFELLYCKECGRLLTTKESFYEAFYEDAPLLCHDCSEEYRKANRGKDEFFTY